MIEQYFEVFSIMAVLGFISLIPVLILLVGMLEKEEGFSIVVGVMDEFM